MPLIWNGALGYKFNNHFSDLRDKLGGTVVKNRRRNFIRTSSEYYFDGQGILRMPAVKQRNKF